MSGSFFLLFLTAMFDKLLVKFFAKGVCIVIMYYQESSVVLHDKHAISDDTCIRTFTHADIHVNIFYICICACIRVGKCIIIYKFGYIHNGKNI